MLHYHTLQPGPVVVSPFHEGDAVFLASGTYQGTTGTFLHLADNDRTWADILEPDSHVRCHPVQWLALRPEGQMPSGST